MNTNRSKKLDFIRAIAILCVVFCHSIESVYYMFQDRTILYSNISTVSKIFDLTGITLGRLGVPLFLFITGILISKKDFSKKENIKKLGFYFIPPKDIILKPNLFKKDNNK